MSKENLVTQVKLKAVDHFPFYASGEQMTTWLNTDGIKVGTVIELRDRPEVWKVSEVYDTLPASKIDTHGWDNNDYTKHVGLWV